MRLVNTRYSLLFVALLSASFGGSCSGGSTASPRKQLPSVVTLEAHAASAVTAVTRRGIDTASRSPGTVEDGESLILTSDADGLEWAIYQFSATTLYHPESVGFNLEGAASEEVFVGVAEWGTKTWDIRGPFSANYNYDLTTGGDYVSTLERVWAVIICFDGNNGKINGLSLNGNVDPFAEFSANPQTGAPGAAVQLDASASYDTDGTIVRYEWDLDDDGVFEVDNGSNPMAQTTLPFPEGSIDVALRVTDDDGALGYKVVTLTGFVSGPEVPVEIAPEAASVNSLVMVNGNPAILFEGPGDIEYIRANDPAGNSWSSPVQVYDTGFDVARLAVVNGKPAVVVPAQGPDQLLYIAAADANGLSWNDPIVAFAGYGSVYPRLAEVNGVPAIAYSTGNPGLFYVQAQNPGGTSWGTPLSIDNRFVYASGAVSFTVVAGRPAIGYAVQDDNGLYYVHALDADGVSWDAPIAVAPATSNFFSALTVVDGKPAMVGYSPNLDEYFYFVRASDSYGNTWIPRIPVISGYAGSMSRNSFAVVGNMPTFVYSDSGPARLEIVCATESDGSIWAAPELLFELATVNNPSPAIADVAGKLGMAFRDNNGSSDALYFYRQN
jgi:PKD repeat protein